MNIYFAIKSENSVNTLYADINEAKDILDSMAQNKKAHEPVEKYSFEAVEMHQEEFEQLPDFQGF